MRPYLEKNPSRKRTGGVAQGIGPEFKSQSAKTNKQKKAVRSKLDCLGLNLGFHDY
jgi:hypothetical protein